MDPLDAAMMAAKGAAAGNQSPEGRVHSTAFSICTIEDSFAHTGSYIVRLPAGRLINACDLNQMGCLPLGARPAHSYPAKARVLVCQVPGLPHAIILGAIPRALADPNLVLPESIVLRSMVGLFQDTMHWGVFTNPQSELGNFSAGRPADILPGDWGVINDLGVAVFIGRMMATLKASDQAKVEAFWGDDLLRLVGYNFEHFTSGAESRCLNDEGEYNEIQRLSMFPWEGMGQAQISDATQNSGGQLKPDSQNAKFEPLQVDQLQVQRYLKLGGYLGDLKREWVAGLPSGLKTEQYGNKTIYPGLLDIVRSSNGAYIVRSAKEILLEKYALIPVPKEMIAPEDPTGDNPTNYRAGDLQGGGSGYQMPEYIWGDDNDPGIRSAQSYEQQAYLTGKYTYYAAVAHKLDWYVPEEGDLTDPISSTVYDKNLKIGYQFLAPLPGFGQLVIDARPGHQVRYYKSRSGVHMMDDGSVVIEDGYGSQLVMKGGSIYLSCVGDIWQQPGRSAVTWAPRDVILRAGHSADISASLHDVRIKAERNMHILAGNDKSHVGGILIETRSEGRANANDFRADGEQVQGHGIILKAPKSTLQMFGQNVYLGRNQTDQGDLVVDAGNQGILYLRGQNIYARSTNLFAVLMEADASPTKQMFAITNSGALVSCQTVFGGNVSIAPSGQQQTADLYVGGAIIAHDGIIAGSNGVVTNGAFAAKQGSPFVGKLDDAIPIPDPSTFSSIVNQEVTAAGQAVQAVETIEITNGQTGAGSAHFQKSVGFSCRSTVQDIQLQAATFVLFEARWQQMLRRKGGGATHWNEPEVLSPTGATTRPHPGQDGWESFSAFGTVDGTNFDYAAGHAADRAAMSPFGPAAQKQTLSGAYLINVQE